MQFETFSSSPAFPSVAPSLLGIRPRNRFSDADEQRALIATMEAAEQDDRVYPVVYGGRRAGYMVGLRGTNLVGFYRMPGDLETINPAYTPPWLAYGITSDSVLKTAIAANQAGWFIYQKGATTAPVANNHYDLWTVGGNPVAGAFGGTALTAVTVSSSSTGAMMMGTAVSPYIKQAVWGEGSASSGTPTFMFGTRVGSYNNCSFVNGSQSFLGNPGGGVSPFSLYVGSNQPGAQVYMVCESVLGATNTQMTVLTYINQAGTNHTILQSPTVAVIKSAATPTATLGARLIAPAATVTSTVTTSRFLPLDTTQGDTGARGLIDVTFDAANSGKVAFVLFYPMFVLATASAGIGVYVEFANMVASLPIVYDNACVGCIASFPTANGPTVTIDGFFVWT